MKGLHRDYIDEQLNTIFEKKSEGELTNITNILSLIIYQNADNMDIVNLYKNLDNENFLKVIDLIGGRTIKLPDRKAIRESIMLSILYYYKEIKGYDWKKIKNLVDFEVNSIKYGLRIKALNNFVTQKLQETFKKLEDDNVQKE